MSEPVRTYYDHPVLKDPTWKAYIPSYFYLGGLAAGSSLLAAGADAVGDGKLRRAAHLTALGAISVGTGALIADLGRPSRFHHMLRVFRPSSPMNVGSWLLSAYGPAVGVAALCDATSSFRWIGRAATWGAAAFAPGVATYTAVIVADTAVPAWHDTGTRLPFVFASGAAASAGGLAAALVPESRAARRFAITGSLASDALASTLHQGLAPEVASAYTDGKSSKLRHIATACGVGGSALVAAGGARRRSLVRLGGVLVAAGALAERFAVIAAGRTSAATPEATIAPQNARLDGQANRVGVAV